MNRGKYNFQEVNKTTDGPELSRTSFVMKAGYSKCEFPDCPLYFKRYYHLPNTRFCGSKTKKTGCSYKNHLNLIRIWFKNRPKYVKDWLKVHPNYHAEYQKEYHKQYRRLNGISN